jgi:hypothetical protein
MHDQWSCEVKNQTTAAENDSLGRQLSATHDHKRKKKLQLAFSWY